jgi:hypothetical protein
MGHIYRALEEEAAETAARSTSTLTRAAASALAQPPDLPSSAAAPLDEEKVARATPLRESRPEKKFTLSLEAELRFNRFAPLGPPRNTAQPLRHQWATAWKLARQTVERPNDKRLRAQVWRKIDETLAASGGEQLVWHEEIAGMGPGDAGPPILSHSQLVPFNDEVGDTLDDARVVLLACSTTKVLHEIDVLGHALDQLDREGDLANGRRRRFLRIDEEITRWRNPLIDEPGNKFHQAFGWANVDAPKYSCLLEHPEHVPLLVKQVHEPNADLAAGAEGETPVLMYAPAVHKLLPIGHPGRVALEALQHSVGDESTTWLDSVLPLPPDHSFAGSTLRQVLTALPNNCKPYGHGHGFEFLTTTGTQGNNVSQTWVPFDLPPKKRRRVEQEVRVQRPLVTGQGILGWNDAASALQYGIVNACIPAAEAALELLLPRGHVAREAIVRHA